ncbi:hypothetical protein LTR95_006412 [Oleoguttula sp. CCFEE 5521]
MVRNHLRNAQKCKYTDYRPEADARLSILATSLLPNNTSIFHVPALKLLHSLRDMNLEQLQMECLSFGTISHPTALRACRVDDLQALHSSVGAQLSPSQPPRQRLLLILSHNFNHYSSLLGPHFALPTLIYAITHHHHRESQFLCHDLLDTD